MDPMSLNWGEATAEFSSDEKNAATHILQHDLSSPEKAARAVRYAIGRVQWFAKSKPGWTQEVWFDDRELPASPELRKSVKEQLSPHVAGLMFFSEGEA